MWVELESDPIVKSIFSEKGTSRTIAPLGQIVIFTGNWHFMSSVSWVVFILGVE